MVVHVVDLGVDEIDPGLADRDLAIFDLSNSFVVKSIQHFD